MNWISAYADNSLGLWANDTLGTAGSLSDESISACIGNGSTYPILKAHWENN